MQSFNPVFRGLQELCEAEATYETICAKALKDISPRDNRVQALRSLPANELIKHVPQDYVSFGLVVENSTKAIWTSTSVAKTLKEGKWNKHVKSVLLGVNKDEGTMFALMFKSYTPAGYDFVCRVMMPKAPREEIDRLYPINFSNQESIQNLDFTTCSGIQLLSDQPFNVPMEHLANILSSTCHIETGEPISVYMYRLDATVHTIESGSGLGAFHSVDVPFLFNIKKCWEKDSANAKTSALIGQSWYNFSKYGCPDSTWPKYLLNSPYQMVFKVNGESMIQNLSNKSKLEKDRYEFWTQFH
ncbi:hypothetical protein CROQUDRAFT_129508 [Cronartium quercuum f. sp. fusiforme G11]|uniref:Carboxylesterase type B domain-containing protein n=1 Tax=Cronartium quercuum f. sp. fusiforme G11 TaxID=708437 RepID=A0A9P6P055_9BASI|nr:hypothetical protein CROQUDRAFT_129508 [Cronartium quercuum f. sp. fusiforme G11]